MQHHNNAVNELLTQAKHGDQQAFDTLLEQYMPVIEHRISSIRSRYSTLTPEDEKRPAAGGTRCALPCQLEL